MQENLYFLTLWRVVQLPDYRLLRKWEHFQAFGSELFCLAEREHTLGKFYHTEPCAELYAEKIVSVPTLQSPPQVRGSLKERRRQFVWLILLKIQGEGERCTTGGRGEPVFERIVTYGTKRKGFSFRLFLTVGFQLSTVVFSRCFSCFVSPHQTQSWWFRC